MLQLVRSFLLRNPRPKWVTNRISCAANSNPGILLPSSSQPRSNGLWNVETARSSPFAGPGRVRTEWLLLGKSWLRRHSPTKVSLETIYKASIAVGRQGEPAMEGCPHGPNSTCAESTVGIERHGHPPASASDEEEAGFTLREHPLCVTSKGTNGTAGPEASLSLRSASHTDAAAL